MLFRSDTLDNLYLRLLAPPLVALVAILGFALFAMLFLPAAGWLLLGLLVPLWLVLTVGCAAWGWRASHRRVDRQEALRVRAVEQVEGLAELTAYGALETHLDHWRAEEQGLLDDQRLLGKRTAAANALTTLVIQFAAVGVLALGLVALSSGAQMVMLTLGTLAVAEGLGGLPMAFTQLGATQRAAERLNAQTALTPEQAGVTLQGGGAAPNLVYRDVGLCQGGRWVLRGVDLILAPGQQVAVIGASGSGKSTLAQLAVRAFDPDIGELRFDDHRVAELSPDSLRARVGYLTQRSELFHDTLAANLRMGDPAASDAQLWAVLEQVDLHEWAEALPQGLQTWVGEQGRQLSGGQARRVALARVMLRNSPLVILDEPLSGLDASTAQVVKAALAHWLAGRTALLLAHESAALPTCDSCWSLVPGAQGATLHKT